MAIELELDRKLVDVLTAIQEHAADPKRLR